MTVKQRIALFMSMMILLATIPAVVFPSAIDVEGDWTTYRSAASYDNVDVEGWQYTPAPGYEYTDEGFHMISADYSGCAPFGTIQSKEKISIRDGVYMELRIDQFSYGGESDTEDHWISFHIWDSQNLAPGSLEYGQGWLNLNRTPGKGGAGSAQSFVTRSSWEDGGFSHQGDAYISPLLDENGKEIYTLEVFYDGSNYHISVCGVPVPSNANITKHLDELDPNGEFYVGATMHSGGIGGSIEATMLKFGTDSSTATVPMGSDSKAPEENYIYVGPTIDPSTVPENMPCLLLDAELSSCRGRLYGEGVTVEPDTSDNSLKLSFTERNAFFVWNIKNTLSYEAQDFPVIAFVIYDPHQAFDHGLLRYSAGFFESADDLHVLPYSIFDENFQHFGEYEEYTWIVLDMQALLDANAYAEGWNGRINSLRFDFFDLLIDSPADPSYDYMHLMYAGVFRSVEEAEAYHMSRVGLETAPPDEPVTEEPTEPVTQKVPQTEKEPVTEKEPKPVPAQTEPVTRSLEEELNKAGYTVLNCGAVSGAATATLLFGAMAAAWVLKKRET